MREIAIIFRPVCAAMRLVQR